MRGCVLSTLTSLNSDKVPGSDGFYWPFGSFVGVL